MNEADRKSVRPHRIDTHHHILPPAYVKTQLERIRASAPNHAAQAFEWSPHKALEAMDRAGIATAVTSISAPGLWFGDAASASRLARECNEFAAQMARDHKGRFGVFASLPMPDVDASLREIEYACGVLKADGFGLMTHYDDIWPGDARVAPVFDELHRRKAVVYFHPTAPEVCAGLVRELPPATLEFPFDTTRSIASLLYSGTLSRCSAIQFIFSHAGGALPMLAERIAGVTRLRKDLLERLPNGVMHELKKLYYDVVSAVNPVSFNAVRQFAGARQLLYGTDFPYWDAGHTGARLSELGLAADDLRLIECDNALGLLPSLAGAQTSS